MSMVKFPKAENTLRSCFDSEYGSPNRSEQEIAGCREELSTIQERTDIYNEREDFLWKMFGIKLRTDESIEYWVE